MIPEQEQKAKNALLDFKRRMDQKDLVALQLGVKKDALDVRVVSQTIIPPTPFVETQQHKRDQGPGSPETKFSCCLYPFAGYDPSNLPFGAYGNYQISGDWEFYNASYIGSPTPSPGALAIAPSDLLAAIASGFYFIQDLEGTVDNNEQGFIYANGTGWAAIDFWQDTSTFAWSIGIGPLNLGACLVGTGSAYSPFLDMYNITDLSITLNAVGSTTPIGGPGTGTCVWTGGGFTLQYNGSGPHIYKWTLNGVEKSDPQTDPTGTYGTHTVA